MPRTVLFVALVCSFIGGIAAAAPVRDWRDLHAVHVKVQQCIKDLERARAANHYDMAGHGAKAEELLRQAEHELHDAVEAEKHAG